MDIIICNVHAYLIREEHKALSAFDLVAHGFAVGIIGEQGAGAGETVVEQIVVSCRRTEGVGRRALFPAKLIKPQINKIFTRKN